MSLLVNVWSNCAFLVLIVIVASYFAGVFD